MTDWSSGYVADVGYTYGYYTELNPQRIRLAFLNNGLVFPEVGTACELGFGQGLSANIHASASNIQWHGTDFNPAQAGFAQELAQVSGNGAQLLDEAFLEFANRKDLPDFDFIGLHGIWSWVNDENRKIIVDFIRRKLKVGGVLYISYNTFPGWAAFAPVRHLMTEHAEIIGSEGKGIISRINDAVGYAEKLMSTNPLYAKANPGVMERLKKIKDQNRQYLAHEFFNLDWHPMHFMTMAKWLEPAKLQFACSADFTSQIDAINMSPEQLAFLNEIPDPLFRQATRDFIVNQQFRKDYWVKGARKLNTLDQLELMRQQKLLLIAPAGDIPKKITTSIGEASLSEAIYNPLIEQLADLKVKTIGKLEQALASKGISFGQLMQAVFVLIGAGHVAPVQEESQISKSRKATDRINAHLMKMSRGTSDVNFVASPVTGGGVTLLRFEQLFTKAILDGQRQPSEWAHSVWSLMQSQGLKLVEEGKTIESPEENLERFNRQAIVFAEKRLPILRALQIL